MKLDELEIGKDAIIASVASDDVALHQHILDMGLTPGTEVTMMKYAPMGDPMEIRLRGYELTLRRDTAARIELVDVHDTDTVARRAPQTGSVAHPALGEGYHPRRTKKAVPEGSPITFALAGNQNCGKTTLFNCLTGSNQHVGNFPGVTVDRKDGQIRNHPEATVTDLPGIYSLSPYTGEEVVSRQFILDSRPDAVIDIIDATNIERNLYLTLQLMELDRPMVIALNMMDEVTANGGTIDVNLLERELGVPVVPISAAKNEGIGELVEHAMHIARYGERPGRIDFCSSAADSPDGGALHRCIHGIANLIEDHAKAAAIPLRFAATKLVEGDALVIEALNLDQNELDAIEHIISQMEEESGSDRLCALADMRFTFIEDVCATCVVKPHESREHKRSVAIDRVLTGRFTAIPMFILIMGLVFWLTFGVIGAALQGLLEQLVSMVIGATDAGLTAFGTNPVVRSLVVDGVLTGVGSGIISRGKILSGLRGGAGEAGHMLLVLDGEPCTCGRRGCWEAYASATALIRQTRQAALAHPESLLAQVEEITGRTAFDAAQQGDATAAEVVARYAVYVAAGLTDFVNILAPEMILLGGGISRQGETLLAPIREYVATHCFGQREGAIPTIAAAKLGNEAGIIGAAAL